MALKRTRRVLIEIVGWILVIVGLAALFLPGPGLLALFAGLAILSQQYTWAERWVEPVKVRAFKTAADGVQTWPRIAASVVAALLLAGVGVVWGLQPPSPSWWPLPDGLWLLGGWGTGGTLIFSAVIALALIVYSYRNFRGIDNPEQAAEDAARDDD